MKQRIAVIGGGWAGCAAALTLAQAGIKLTLFEAGLTLGGRARSVQVNNSLLDNGQHILLGAYTQTLKLISEVGSADSATSLMRLPLTLEQPPDFSLVCPLLPAPLHLLAGLFGAHGLNWHEKFAAARWARHALTHTPINTTDTLVSNLLKEQPEKVRKLLWEPLCISALNTAPEHASAQVFKQVLVAAFAGRRCHSDLLLPRRDLTAMFPQPAAQRIAELGGEVRLRARVKSLSSDAGGVSLMAQNDSTTYDHIILAVAPQHLASLCRNIPELADTIQTVETYDYEPIATGYLQYPLSVRLSRPILALSGEPAQFVFDRGQTHGQTGLLAVVVSAASNLLGQSQTNWLAQAERQLARIATLPTPLWRKTIIEKQATYACRPNMPRLDNITPHPRIFLAGDYTSVVYPATLESATLSGVKSALALLDRL